MNSGLNDWVQTMCTIRSVLVLLLAAFVGINDAADTIKSWKLNVRHRVETVEGSGRYHTLTGPEYWIPNQTCIVVCDMWDKHWCDDSTRRVAEMAPRMNEVLKVARDKGVLIIHCPSETMGFYEGTPQRKLAQEAPKVE